MKTAIKMAALLGAVICFQACVSTSSATYRLRGSDEAAWDVEGSWNQATDKVRIVIDGTTVISGSVGIFSSTKTLKGKYLGHSVSAILTRNTSFLGVAKMHCVVSIDGEIAANFDW